MLVWTAGVLWALAGTVATAEEEAHPCPILKVVITEFPTPNKLMMHPAPEEHYTMAGSSAPLFALAKRQGIRVAVLWENRTGQELKDLTLRLEYQQAKGRAFRTMEQRFPTVPPKGQWTHFELKGGEYEDTAHVAAWRVTALGGGHVLGAKHSVMWSLR